MRCLPAVRLAISLVAVTSLVFWVAGGNAGWTGANGYVWGPIQALYELDWFWFGLSRFDIFSNGGIPPIDLNVMLAFHGVSISLVVIMAAVIAAFPRAFLWIAIRSSHFRTFIERAA